MCQPFFTTRLSLKVFFKVFHSQKPLYRDVSTSGNVEMWRCGNCIHVELSISIFVPFIRAFRELAPLKKSLWI